MPRKEYFELYIKTTESSYGGEPESDDQWCHHSDVVRTVSFDSVSRNRGSGFWGCGESFEVSKEVFNSDRVYLVIVRYSDGGTFGRTVGNWHVQDAFVDEESALKLASSILDRTYEKENPQAYKPWIGYFSGLEDVEVHCFTVRDNPGNPSSSNHGPSVIYH